MLDSIVKEFVNTHLPQHARIIVGLSGGVDSMALLLSLKQAGCDIVATHCNFHLRGEESERDCLHCENVCEKLDIKLLVNDFDVESYRAANSVSIEMACRELRYNWWKSLIENGEADFIAVGHHREDNIETFFLNLLRGSGIAGLKGMLPVNGNVIRPLLSCTRSEIEQYVTSSGFTWVNDHTNYENEFKRNRLRNIILPIFEQEFPGATEGMAHSIDILRDNFALYSSLVRDTVDKYVSADGSVDVHKLVKKEKEPLVLLHEILPKLGLSHSQTKNLYQCVCNADSKTCSGQRFITPEGTFILERGILHKVTANFDNWSDETVIQINIPPFSIKRMSIHDFKSELMSSQKDDYSIYFDPSVLEDTPTWSIRSWRRGDRFAPYGMKGTKLVSDIYSDAKYNFEQKQSVKILCRNGIPLWLIGLRASSHFKVTDISKEVIKLTLNRLWKS